MDGPATREDDAGTGLFHVKVCKNNNNYYIEEEDEEGQHITGCTY